MLGLGNIIKYHNILNCNKIVAMTIGTFIGQNISKKIIINIADLSVGKMVNAAFKTMKRQLVFINREEE